MKVSVQEDGDCDDIQVIIKCKQKDERIQHLIKLLQEVQDKPLIGFCAGKKVVLNPPTIYYFESVDKKTFAYTNTEVYEVNLKLYEIEETFKDYHFFRASKSSVINVSKIQEILPVLSGRLEVTLENNERMIVSRQYVPRLREILGY